MKNISVGVKRVLIMIALFGALSTVIGCRNTAHGVGQDMERTGEKIQDSTR